MGNKQQFLLEDLPEVIFGAEDDEKGNDSSGGSAGASSDSSKEDKGDAGSGSDDSSGSSHDDADDEATKGLKSALAAERKANKDKEKELRLLRKTKDDKDLAEKDEVDQANIKAERATEKATKLAAGMLTRDLNDAIKSAAAAAGFIDTSDAIEGILRDSITFEQDEEDPAQITIDEKSVQKAVKDLATKKPHFLKKGTDDGEPSGSQFGGSRTKKQTDTDSLRDKYPSLR